jgi:hypothetical protein
MSFQLPRDTDPTRALDLLIKTFYVLEIHFPLGWKNVLRFLAVHIFKIMPSSPKVSIFMQEWMKLNAIQE